MIMLDDGRVFKNHDELNFALHGTPMPEKKPDTIEKTITQHMENSTSNPITAGTIVYLKSGSPAMTAGLSSNANNENEIECVWFIESRLERESFTPAILTTEKPAFNPF